VPVDKPIVVPNVKPGPNARDIHALGNRDRFLIVVMFHVFRRIDVVAMIHEMHPVERHDAFFYRRNNDLALIWVNIWLLHKASQRLAFDRSR